MEWLFFRQNGLPKLPGNWRRFYVGRVIVDLHFVDNRDRYVSKFGVAFHIFG
jgi:hypothetical protein